MKRSLKPMVAAILVAMAASIPAQAQAAGQPGLVLLTVGVSKFQQAGLEKGVRFAAKDASDVADLFRAQEGRLFGKVHHRSLTNEQATTQNILAALEWVRTTATPDSYVVVYFAGHGGPDSLGNYLYCTHDCNPILPSTLLNGMQIRNAIGRTPGKRFLVLDTCFAAGAAGVAGDGLPQGTGFVTFAACLSIQTSSEEMAPANGNGFFTKAFLEGLQGKADANHDGIVTLAELDAYVAERVQALSNGRQQTTMARPASIESRLPLAMVGGSATPASNPIMPIYSMPPASMPPVAQTPANSMPPSDIVLISRPPQR